MNGNYWRHLLCGSVAPLCLTAGLVHAAGPFPFTDEWYRQRADDPPGSRQVERHGKLWPPQPRPVGRKQTFVHAYHSAHYWPYPYNCEDEAYVRGVIDQQSMAGWQVATTLHDYHFNSDTNDLNDAGAQHIQYIGTRVPAQYRTIYVAQGTNPEIGQARTAFVQDYIQRVGMDASIPVITRVETFNGRPANEVDRLRELELNAIQPPRLFRIGSGRSSGGSQAAGQQGGGNSSGGNSGGGSSSGGTGTR